MGLEHPREWEAAPVVLGRVQAVCEADGLKVELSRTGKLALLATCSFALLGPGLFVAWMAAYHANENLPIVAASYVVVAAILFAGSWSDFAFATITFDRKAGRIERRGESIGTWGEIRSIRIVDRPHEAGQSHYVVLLEMQGQRPGKLELGDHHENAAALGYAAVIAKFLGIEVG